VENPLHPSNRGSVGSNVPEMSGLRPFLTGEAHNSTGEAAAQRHWVEAPKPVRMKPKPTAMFHGPMERMPQMSPWLRYHTTR
jgi:hypothetical protein